MSYPPLPSNGETQWGDKFRAWADALEGRKVEGNGMSLRYDTSVGTRVLLDHPGGTTMLHGDTGWRDVTSLISTPGLTLSLPSIPLQMKRVDDRVSLAGMLVNDSSVANAILLTFPAGAMPAIPYTSHGVGKCGTEPVFFNTAASSSVLRISGTITAGTPISFDISWITRQPWPATLWGLPS